MIGPLGDKISKDTAHHGHGAAANALDLIGDFLMRHTFRCPSLKNSANAKSLPPADAMAMALLLHYYTIHHNNVVLQNLGC